MTVTLGPRLGLMLNAAAGDAHPNEFRDFLRGMDALCQISAKSRTTTAQPSSPTNGDTYILPASATGRAWGGRAAGIIAYYTTQQTITSGGTESTVSGWDFFTPKRGYIANVEDESDSFYKWTGSTWAPSNVDDVLVVHKAGVETVSGAKTFSADLTRDGAPGTSRSFLFTSNNISRWKLSTHPAAESGSNAGSDFTISRYDDSGNRIADAVTITRSTGAVAIPAGAYFSATCFIGAGPDGNGALLRLRDIAANGSNTSIGGILFNSAPGSDFLLAKKSVNSISTFVINTGVGATLLSISDVGIVSISGGINLGGTANLTAYDEGTWTPTSSGLGGTEIIYLTKWHMVGNTVDFEVRIHGVNITATSAVVSLPFAPARPGAAPITLNGVVPSGAGLIWTDGYVHLPSISATSDVFISGKIFLN